MKIINQIRSTFLCFKASRYQGAGQFEKVIELGLKANELTPNDSSVAAILYSGYSSLSQWNNAKDIAHERLTIGDPYDVSWNKRLITSLCHLDSPIDELRPYLYAYVEGRSKTNWDFSNFGFKETLVLYVADIIVWPIIFLKSGKNIRASSRFKKILQKVKESEDEFYQWVVNTLEYHEK